MTNADLILAFDEWFRQAAVIFFRIGAIVSVMPGVGTRMVPVRVKLAFAIALTVFLTPAVSQNNLQLNLTVIPKETLVGLTFGLGLRFFMFALQTAGTVAAQSTSLSQILGNSNIDPMPAIGHILTIGGLALFFVADLHLYFVFGLLQLYEIWPVGAVLRSSDLAEWGTQKAADSFALAFRLAAPFVILSMLYNVTLGVINKAMPQLMVSFVGAPVITLGGLIFLALSAPVMLLFWADAVQSYLHSPIGDR